MSACFVGRVKGWCRADRHAVGMSDGNTLPVAHWQLSRSSSPKREHEKDRLRSFSRRPVGCRCPVQMLTLLSFHVWDNRQSILGLLCCDDTSYTLATVSLSCACTVYYCDRLDTEHTVRLAKPMGPSGCYWRVLGNKKKFKIATQFIGYIFSFLSYSLIL